MKNIVALSISGGVGLVFMILGLLGGLMLAPMPSLPKPVVKTAPVSSTDVSKKLKTITLPTDPLNPEAVRKTYESLLDLNNSLQAKAHDLEVREGKLKQSEEDITNEKKAIEASHKKLSDLFDDLQQRLILVENQQVSQIQREVTLYNTMELPQAVDIIRAREDSAVIRLFAVMEDKQLAQTLNAWKKKYPDETPRLLGLLDGLSKVFPKDKMAAPAAVASSEPPANAPVVASNTSPSNPSSTGSGLPTSPEKPNTTP